MLDCNASERLRKAAVLAASVFDDATYKNTDCFLAAAVCFASKSSGAGNLSQQ
jgi:hypothetical protein